MIGFTSVTFRNLSVDRIIELAVEAGAECIEWGGDIHVTDVKSAEYARQKCMENNIAVNSYGSYFRMIENSIEDFEAQCRICKALGAKVIRIWAGIKGSARTDEATLQRIVEQGRAMAKIAAEYGITVAAEFHDNTYNDDGESSLHLLKLIGCNNFKTYWQPKWHGNDVLRAKTVADNCVNVHLFYWDLLGTRRRLLADGKKKLIPMIEELKKQEFSGDWILEFVKGDSEAAFLEDMKTLRELCS